MKPLGLLLCVAFSAGVCHGSDAVERVEVFKRGDGEYHTYRIPAVLLTAKNTLLAFCEGRKTGSSDHGDIDLLLRRSTDGGKTWQAMQLVHEEGGTARVTIGNPCPVLDRDTGTVWLSFCRDNKDVFLTHSTDDGRSWAKPVDITPRVNADAWPWFATGPGHGIQLKSGRLLMPCDCANDRKKLRHSFVIFSDDHGKTWTRGGLTENDMNECQAVERADGAVLLCMRNYRGKNQRAFAVSTDGGESWTGLHLYEQVYCPTCEASILRLSLPEAGGPNRILYSGPGGPKRNNLTIRLSLDEGKTWPIAKVLHPRSVAYSDLVRLPDGTVGCLYEHDGYRAISFARFSLDWLTDGKESPAKR